MVERIKQLCKQKGMTIASLERICGFGNGSISKWNKHRPADFKVEAVAEALGTTKQYLLWGETGIKKEPPIPTDEELDKNDALWETYDGMREDTKDLPLHEANLIFKMLDDGGHGMNFNELYAFTSVLSKLTPEQRLRLFQLADKLQQDKSAR